ncbi:MAG: hypothetical protein WDO18_10020 [Acidobacteriota bacterium]
MRFFVVAALAALPVAAQWKLPASAVKLEGPAAKTADGKPDLSGIWEQASTKHFLNLMADMKADEYPYKPETKAIVDSRKNGAQGRFEPDANCLPQGVPKINAAPVPFKIVQTPNLVVLVYEAFNLWRQVHLDGRELLEDPNPTWLGYSAGHWDGDTLVVESRGFNGKPWLDMAGNPGSESLHVTEKFHRTSLGSMDLEITIDDPKMYTRVWTAKEKLRLVQNTEIMEFICLENEKDLKHMVN